MSEEFHPSERSLVAATVAITATYVYFLIFAQFGFLKALANLGPENNLVRSIMAVMGVAGIGGSVGMARIFHERRCREQLMVAFVIAGMAAGLAAIARTPTLFFISAALTGTGTGMVTVGLAGMLRREVGGERLGACIGLGTGLAYALCNLPPIFAAKAQAQAVLGLAAACTGLIAIQLFEQRAPRFGGTGPDYTVRGKMVWVAIFLVLVGIDSAVFSIIQHTAGLKVVTWSGGPRLFLIAGMHLAAGVLAGKLLDRRWVTGTVGAAAGLLVLAMALVGRHPLAAGLYAAGVSLYSAALVFYPARSGRPELAALVYAIAGWIGSALGLGLARDLHEVSGGMPGWAAALLAGLFFSQWRSRRAAAVQ